MRQLFALIFSSCMSMIYKTKLNAPLIKQSTLVVILLSGGTEQTAIPPFVQVTTEYQRANGP